MKKTAMLLGLLLSTAARAAPDASPITVSIVGLEDVSVGLGGMHFTVLAELTRTAGLPMVLQSMDYEIRFSDQVIGRGSQEGRYRLRRDEPVVVEIPCQLGATAGLFGLLGQGADAEVEIVGEATGRWLFFSRTREFQKTISLQEAMALGKQEPAAQ